MNGGEGAGCGGEGVASLLGSANPGAMACDVTTDHVGSALLQLLAATGVKMGLTWNSWRMLQTTTFCSIRYPYNMHET